MLTIVAVGGGTGAAVAVTQRVIVISTGKRAIIRKIRGYVTTGALNGQLWIGHRDLAGNFQQDLPAIAIINGQDFVVTEEELPNRGNTIQGFMADTTAGAGAEGAIYAETNCPGVAVAAPVIVQIEVEEE